MLISDELFGAFLKCKTKAHLTALAFGQERMGDLRTQSVTGNGTSLKAIRRNVVTVSDLRIVGTALLAARAQKI